MKSMQQLALILSLAGAVLLPTAARATDPAPAPAAAAPAAVDEKAAPRLDELSSAGSKPERCRTPGMGMQGGPMGMMGMMGMAGKCDHPDCPKDKCLHGSKEKCDHPGHHAQHGHHGQPCHAGDLDKRVEMLEKRLDMMQMMMRKMMRD